MGWLNWFWTLVTGRGDPEGLRDLDARLARAHEEAPVWKPSRLRKRLRYSMSSRGAGRRATVREDLAGTDARSRRRLNSLTMRATDWESKTLATDSQQLERYGLPAWYRESDVADALGITPSELRWFASHRNRDSVCHYVPFTVPKSDGTERVIMAPKPRLKSIQRSLVQLVVNRLPVHDSAHGFREGHSVRTAAEPHVGQEFVIRFDIADFFPAVSVFRVRGLLLALGYGFPVATTLAALMTEAERRELHLSEGRLYEAIGERYCVQGAPTSPGLCNSIAQKLDRRLAGLARSVDWRYTRYADDLFFSGQDSSACTLALKLVPSICREEGFPLRREKTRVARRSQCQRVTGVVVNDQLGLSRQHRRRLRATAHQLRLSAHAPGPDFAERLESLQGSLAYLQMLNPDQADRIRRCWPEMLR